MSADGEREENCEDFEDHYVEKNSEKFLGPGSSLPLENSPTPP